MYFGTEKSSAAKCFKTPSESIFGQGNAKPRGQENAQIQTFTHGLGHMCFRGSALRRGGQKVVPAKRAISGNSLECSEMLRE